ncbi:GNAT family N-acetyltransferase [Neorhizobium galegae]|uniref:GNAT family N-acetyltransferase n=1 Tax=Neorhizobium galegae TaxID=399 RepID=UPI0006213D9B|nr:GNAT family N-acetyltransferase [Neorhizobium galegae]CDZ25659.1 Putative acetyltransferase YhhY [Neorhizobium galegae bv. officinalis]KAA9387485.1 GNAT family N-acetyltransferase [Neorhizobium galegae]KAB1114619.1 GNAT family N-acetyltransferase [Neorhizobium galegae]MCM2499268.1 GNAT family N-acetyltransferase [Neorhizobium galegae]MCQ1772624.1 GNAT family N-acetyltransferase [Neorhizobium galegae]
MTDFDIPPPLDPDARWPEGLSIRARTPADAPDIAALHNLPGYRYGTLRTPHHRPEEIRKGIENQSANFISLVAVLKDRIVGDVGMTHYANRRAHAGSIGMGVHDAYTGRGIGRALIGEILATADRWLDLKRIELTVYTDNETAIRLYERNGFVKEGHFKQFAFRDGEYVDAYSMARFRA